MADDQYWSQIMTILFPHSFVEKLRRLRQQKEQFYHVSLLSDDEQQYWHEKVLVGSVKNISQFETNLIHRFYHIPQTLLEENAFPITYIALYQSNRFFGKRSGILYYGKVKNMTLLRRNEIKEIPSERENLYYRFDVESWESLPRKILVKEQGSAAFITNFYLLNHARETPHLWMRTPLDSYLYEFLLSAEREQVDFQYKKGIVRVRKNQIILKGSHKASIKLNYDEFCNAPSICIAKIRRYFLD